jgi:hypothetical protein
VRAAIRNCPHFPYREDGDTTPIKNPHRELGNTAPELRTTAVHDCPHPPKPQSPIWTVWATKGIA